MNDMDDYLKTNQERWDQLAGVHLDSPFYDMAGFKAGKERLHSIELEELGDVRGKTMLHLQCHFGLDTLAWARHGAEVSGVDFSPKAIDLARELSAELGIPAQFYCTDLYKLPDLLSAEFDIVFTSYGVLHGLPDLSAWGQLIARYLKPGGIFYIVEDHPFLRVFRYQSGQEIKAERPYFHSDTPQRLEISGSYALGEEGEASVQYIWDHSIGDVLNALITAGLEIEFLHEFPYAARAKFPFMEQGADGWWRLPADQHRTIPFLFSLQARKPILDIEGDVSRQMQEFIEKFIPTLEEYAQ